MWVYLKYKHCKILFLLKLYALLFKQWNHFTEFRHETKLLRNSTSVGLDDGHETVASFSLNEIPFPLTFNYATACLGW